MPLTSEIESTDSVLSAPTEPRSFVGAEPTLPTEQESVPVEGLSEDNEIYNRSKAMLDASPGGSLHTYQAKEDVNWFEAANAQLMDDSVIRHGANLIQDLWDNDKRGTESQLLEQNIDSVMTGLEEPHLYIDEILETGNMELAQRKVERIRMREKHERMYDRQGGVAMATSAMAGFMADPVNLIGAGVATKLGMAVANRAVLSGVVKSPGRAMIGSQMLTQTGMEALRTTPRLLADPTFRQEQYMTNLAMVMGATGVLSAVPSAMRGLRQNKINKGLATQKEVSMNNWSKSMDDVRLQQNERLMNYKNQKLDQNIELRTAANRPAGTPQLPGPHTQAMTIRDQANTQVKAMQDYVASAGQLTWNNNAADVAALGAQMDTVFEGATRSFVGDKVALQGAIDKVADLPTFSQLTRNTELEAPTSQSTEVATVEPVELTPRQIQEDILQAREIIGQVGDNPAISRAFDAMDNAAKDQASRTGDTIVPRKQYKPTSRPNLQPEIQRTTQSLQSLYDAGVDMGIVRGVVNRASNRQGSLSEQHLYNNLANNGLADTILQISQRGTPGERVIARRLHTGIKAMEDNGMIMMNHDPNYAHPGSIEDMGTHYDFVYRGNLDDGIPAQEMILHEAVHLLTQRKINEGLVDNSFFDEIRTMLKASDNDYFVQYAAQDNHELLAMALTNPKTQEVMMRLDFTDEAAGWSKFVDSMQSIHNVPNSVKNTWNITLQAADGMMPASTYASLADQITAAYNATGGDAVKLQNLSEDITHSIHEMMKEIDARPGNQLTPQQAFKQREGILDLEDFLQSKTFNKSTATEGQQKWQDVSDQYEIDAGEARFDVQKQYNSMTQRILSNSWAGYSHSMATRLMRSEAPLAEWFAQTILELPSGTGGLMARKNTASILSETLNLPYTRKLGISWEDGMKKMTANQDLPAFKKLKARKSSPNQDDVAQEFSDMAMLEMNARQLGRDSGLPDYVKEFANNISEMNDSLYDLQFNNKIDGITGNNRMKHYMKQSVAQGQFLSTLREMGDEGMSGLLNKALTGGGVPEGVAGEMADALMKRMKKAGDARQTDDFMPTREDLINEMRANGVSERIIKETQEHFGMTGADNPGYTARRAFNFDLSAEHNGVRMLDLMNKDIVQQTAQYAKEATGLVAFAKSTGGLVTSMADMEDLIQTMAIQAESRGSFVNVNDVTKVVRSMLGLAYDGQMPMSMRKVRDATSLAGMNGLGESQLAEAGLAMNRGTSGLAGTRQYVEAAMGRFQEASMKVPPTQRQAEAIKFFNDLQELTGLMQDTHIVDRRGVHFDARDQADTMNAMQKALDAGTMANYQPVLSYLQSRYTGYGAIRTAEEQIAMAGALHDFAKFVDPNRTSFTSLKRFTDMGFTNPDGTSTFSKYFEDGTVKYDKNGYVTTLNLHRWTPNDKESLSVALSRHAGQVVQKTFAGEASPTMMTPQAAFINQFKSYPITAAEKQQARNFKFADKELATGLLLNGVTSGIARSLRYHSLAMAMPEGDRERYLDEKHDPKKLMEDAFVYMGMAGMLPSLDELSGQLGGPTLMDRSDMGGNLLDSIPVVGWAEGVLGGVEGAKNLVTGDGNERDIANIQAGMPLGTIKYMNFLAGLIRTRMEDEGAEPPVNRVN